MQFFSQDFESAVDMDTTQSNSLPSIKSNQKKLLTNKLHEESKILIINRSVSSQDQGRALEHVQQNSV